MLIKEVVLAMQHNINNGFGVNTRELRWLIESYLEALERIEHLEAERAMRYE